MTKDIFAAYSAQQEEVKELRGRIDKINRDIKRMENGECVRYSMIKILGGL